MTQQYEQPLINGLGGDARTITATGDLTTDDTVVIADTTGGALTATLPPASARPGQTLVVVAVDTNGATIAAAVGDTILGTITSPIVTDGGSVTLVSDGGTRWLAISDNP